MSYNNTSAYKVIIDPDGDLCLIVGSLDPVTFVVCPKALARASPVWKKLLYGGFVESIRPDKASGEDWVVSLPDDHPKAMEMILDIIHCRFDRIPLSLSFHLKDKPSRSITLLNLYQLTVLTDKYDLARILRPWAEKWADDLERGWRHSSCIEPHCWIACELGCKRIFENMAQYLIQNTVLNPAGKLINRATNVPLFSTSLEPGDLYDFIAKNRLAAIESLLKPITDVINHLCTNKDFAQSLCRDGRVATKLDCEVTMLGAIVRSLTAINLWPIPSPEAVHISVLELANELLPIDSRSRLQGHISCLASDNIVDKAKAMIDQCCPPLEPSTIQHIEAQAKKTGLSSNT